MRVFFAICCGLQAGMVAAIAIYAPSGPALPILVGIFSFTLLYSLKELL